MRTCPLRAARRVCLAVGARIDAGLDFISRGARRRAATPLATSRRQLVLAFLCGVLVTGVLTGSSVLLLALILILVYGDDFDIWGLQVAYRGAPVTVDSSRMKTGMSVPMRGGANRLGDEDAGAVAATLFNDALAAGAIAAPARVRLECYTDDDEIGGGIILIAFPNRTGARAGVTTGWRDTANIAADEHQDPQDPALVASALEFFAAELNTALLWS